jgi:hypothetical protein
MPELWIPGAAGPQDELVKRIERRIEEFRAEHGLERAGVSVELADGSLHRLASISAEPGFGFVTLCPHCDEGEPEELIVPIGVVREIRIGIAEDEPRFGFAVPEGRDIESEPG